MVQESELLTEPLFADCKLRGSREELTGMID